MSHIRLLCVFLETVLDCLVESEKKVNQPPSTKTKSSLTISLLQTPTLQAIMMSFDETNALELLSGPIGALDDMDMQTMEHSEPSLKQCFEERAPSVSSSDSSHSNSYHPKQPQQQCPTVNQSSYCANFGAWDVPMGRAQEVRDFIGNQRFRQLIEDHRVAYEQATKRADKAMISSKILDTIRSNGGRFLDRVKVDGKTEWTEISQDKALAKIAQAMRMTNRRRKTSSTSSFTSSADERSVTSSSSSIQSFHSSMYKDSSYAVQPSFLQLEPLSHHGNSQCVYFGAGMEEVFLAMPQLKRQENIVMNKTVDELRMWNKDTWTAFFNDCEQR